MNGQLILVLLSMLLQNPAGEVMPSSPNLPPQGFPAGLPAPQSQFHHSIPDHIGWGMDRDNKFCMIIQISPNKITEFAQGTRGQELPTDVPEELRGRIQRVVFRVGNEPVERVPANLQTLADHRTSPNPTIMNLDGSNPSSLGPVAAIDKPRNPGIFTAAQSGGGFTNNGTSSINNDPNLYPNTPSSNDYLDRTRTNGLNGTNGTNGFSSGSSSLDNRFASSPSSQEVLPGASNSSRRDGFTAQSNPTKFPPIFQQNNGTASVANGPYAQPNPPYSAQPNSGSSLNGYNNGPYGTNPQNRLNLASNPTTPNFGNESTPYLQNQQPSPSQGLAQQYGQTPIPPPAAYPGSQYQSPVFNSLAQGPIPIGKTPSSQHLDGTTEDQAKDKFLPFLLLISIVGNVYLGLWMNHLRTRYRLLLSNMRGVPISDLA